MPKRVTKRTEDDADFSMSGNALSCKTLFGCQIKHQTYPEVQPGAECLAEPQTYRPFQPREDWEERVESLVSVRTLHRGWASPRSQAALN